MLSVMPGLVPGIHVFLRDEDVDGRDKPGHDGWVCCAMTLTIRRAAPADAALVFALVCELADYENLQHEVDATPDGIAEALFAPEPRLYCDLAEWNGEPAGFAVWFLNFSTFRGRHGLYLEDVFVRPEFRGRGIGKALMQKLAQTCIDNGYARFEWAVLDWNAPSIAFYESLGAEIKGEWKLCRMSGAALARFAAKAPASEARG